MIRCKPHRNLRLPIELLQVDQDKTRALAAERPITFDIPSQQYQKGGWLAHKGVLAPGIYCVHCLAEGKQDPLDYDEVDLEDAGLLDTALVFCDAASFQIEQVWVAIEERFTGAIVAVKESEPRPARYAPLPTNLIPAVRQAFQRKFGADAQLYTHQARAVELAIAGEDVVVETATASGKSLTYTLPILNVILADPSATALYISPLNALSDDQFESFTDYDESGTDWTASAKDDPQTAYLRKLRIGGQKVQVARYYGEVDKAYRQPIRQSVPNILITTPDMLHMGILSNADGWESFLRHLRYVVIDEVHGYKGVFGSHVANVMRRLRRICAALGSSPQFISCSATIKNPVDLAGTISGRKPVLVGNDEDGSERRRRRFVLFDAARTSDAINTEAKNLMVELLAEHRIKSIAFMRSIAGVRALDQYLREDLPERLGVDHRIAKAYYRSLPTVEKRQITRALQRGAFHGVVTTTALQMGIDIGELSACLIVKYPGSMAAVGQQAGRVGRRGEGLIFLLLDRDPLNQFFARHPEEFFTMGPEEVYLDPENPYIVRDHLCCAAKERPIDPKTDAIYWGDALTMHLTDLVASGHLQHDPSQGYVLTNPETSPTNRVRLRGIGFEVPVFHENKEIMRDDSARAPRSLHAFSRFTHDDGVYEVSSLTLDLEAGRGSAAVRKVMNSDFVTVSSARYTTEIQSTFTTDSLYALPIGFGTIQLTTEVVGYYTVPASAKKLQEKPQYHGLGKMAPPKLTYTTQSVWVELQPKHYRGMNEADLMAGTRSMQKALRLAACVELRADEADIGGVEQVPGPNGKPLLFLYDSQPGGTGLAEKSFAHLQKIMVTARAILRDCPHCSAHPDSRGCARCVSEEWGDAESIDRRAALRLFDAILGE